METLQASAKPPEISEFTASPGMRRQLMRLRDYAKPPEFDVREETDGHE